MSIDGYGGFLAVKNLKAAEQEARALTIFDFERVVA